MNLVHTLDICTNINRYVQSFSILCHLWYDFNLNNCIQIGLLLFFRFGSYNVCVQWKLEACIL